MSEDEIIYIDDDDNTKETESASSESTGSAFGGLEDDSSVTYNQPNENLYSNNMNNYPRTGGLSKPLSNMANNMLGKKLGKNDNIPESLKKRKNSMPSTKANKGNDTDKNNAEKQEENNQSGQTAGLGQSNQNANGKEKGTIDQAADAVAKKGGSAAMQAVGVPKPLADFIANKFLSGKSLKMAIIGGVIAFFVQLIIIICIIYLLFMPILKGLESIGDIKEGVGNFFDSAGNWISGDGWCANEQECAETAEKKFYDKVETVANKYPNVDMSIVLSAVLYGMNGDNLFEIGNSDYCTTKYQDATEIANCEAESDYEEETDTYQEAKSNLSKVAKKLSKGKDEFDKYMIDTFIPNTYEETIKNGKSAERILDDIYLLASFFNDYKNVTANISSGGICSYSVNGQEVSNIKVRLLNCNGNSSGSNDPIDDEELIDFDKYVLGVTYAENAGAPTEGLKAQAIAARSYALARVKSMGGNFGISLEQDGDQWILSIRNCTNDQVYCDPDKGCWSDSNDAGDTVHSGYVEGKAWGKPPLAQDSEIRTAVAAVKGMALIDSSGNIVGAPYTDEKQNSWNKKANEGKDYNEILLEEYPNAKTIMANCSVALSGDWSTWKQNDSRWGNTIMGNNNCKLWEYGCLVTSISVQIARSGTQINLPNGVTEFNPGTFVSNNQGMFNSNCEYLGNSYWKQSMVPNFDQVNKVNDICGTRQEKVNKVTEYINQGYYLVTRVKYEPYGQHWVAVIGTQGNEIIIVDSGWPTTELFSYYGALGANSNCLTTYLFKKND